MELQKSRKRFADSLGPRTIFRLLRPALFDDPPDGFCQLRSFTVNRAIRTSVLLDNESVEMCRGNTSEGDFVRKYLPQPSGDSIIN